MNSGLPFAWGAYLESVGTSPSLDIGNSTSLFKTIPPERVGLNGEYDHTGLAKRVTLTFAQEFESFELANLKILQRGRVVILMGRVSSQRLLNRMVQTALHVHGAADVEIHGVSIEPECEYREGLDRFNRHFYAC